MRPTILDCEFMILTLWRKFRRIKNFEVFKKTGSQFRE
jgi:hypothetical protein